MPHSIQQRQMSMSHDTIAAIDIGTNSFHLVVARMDDAGHMKILDMDKVAVRLGRSIGANGAITRDGIVRAVEALRHMQEISSAYECRMRAVATHATREATNSHELLEAIHLATGIKVEVIDGIEEARLVFLGMRYGLHLDGQTCLGVDIGGGSSEIIIAKGDDVRFITSLKMGAVTLSHKHCGVKGPSPKDIKALYADIQQRLAPLLNQGRHLKFGRAIASSGTAKVLASINVATMRAREVTDTNGFTISSTNLERICDHFERLRTPTRIRDEMGIDPSRADIILAGAAILRSIGRAFGVKEWTSSSFGLREGLVVDTWRRLVPERISHAPNVRQRSVHEFSRRVSIDEPHATQVRYLAELIFDQTALKVFPRLDRESVAQMREFLGVAAQLHEAGKFISIPGYHKHSHYLIANSRLMGFTQDERQFIALLARHHRKSMPAGQIDGFEDFSRAEYDRLRYLAAILRLGVALNRTRQARVKAVRIRFFDDRVTLTVVPKGGRSLEVELLKAAKECEHLGRILGLPVVMSGPGFRQAAKPRKKRARVVPVRVVRRKKGR